MYWRFQINVGKSKIFFISDFQNKLSRLLFSKVYFMKWNVVLKIDPDLIMGSVSIFLIMELK